MFEQTFVVDGKTKRERSIAFALILQVLGVTGLALLPLISAESISAGKRFVLLPPAKLQPEPPKLQRADASRSNVIALRTVQLDSVHRPFVAPTHVVPLDTGDAPPLATGSALNAGVAGDVLAAIADTGAVAPPAFTAAPLRPKPVPAPVRISSTMTQSQLLSGPKPAYPRLALSARIEGTVRLQAIISREGRIEHLHVLTGHPLLNAAAIEAVREWRYRPLLLNGEPTEVITEIDVNFTLK